MSGLESEPIINTKDFFDFSVPRDWGWRINLVLNENNPKISIKLKNELNKQLESFNEKFKSTDLVYMAEVAMAIKLELESATKDFISGDISSMNFLNRTSFLLRKENLSAKIKALQGNNTPKLKDKIKPKLKDETTPKPEFTDWFIAFEWLNLRLHEQKIWSLYEESTTKGHTLSIDLKDLLNKFNDSLWKSNMSDKAKLKVVVKVEEMIEQKLQEFENDNEISEDRLKDEVMDILWITKEFTPKKNK